MTGVREFQSPEGLRDHLEDLNESGRSPIAVGTDNLARPFLITLVGPYAEGEEVFFDSPWQSDVEYGRRVEGTWVPLPPRCDDCLAHVHGLEDISFPARVMVP